ncbi:Tn3 family transposase [Streptomyces sp. NPDC002446]
MKSCRSSIHLRARFTPADLLFRRPIRDLVPSCSLITPPGTRNQPSRTARSPPEPAHFPVRDLHRGHHQLLPAARRPVFALAHLLGFDLMPRIRNWKELTCYRPSKQSEYVHIGPCSASRASTSSTST